MTHISFIVIGLSSGIAPLTKMPGWDSKHQWWGYHGDDGGAYHNSDSSNVFYEKYEKGDVVGCGVDQQGKLFFTKNGKKQDTPFHDISGQMFPVAGMTEGGHIRANFGPEFMYQFGNEDEDAV
ncbi:hypothetical protein K440DRAFT_25403 [Wilcoxina mikolae CBS 423.85]|nr:hypothetical protein K440DRAFT_25403 [Wilcoxina mikolae CBS 423.85]